MMSDQREWRLLAICYAFITALSAYPLICAWNFELFGYPVISNGGHWLGPTPRRHANCLDDVGKVMQWTCSDASIFQSHAYFCAAWLQFNGLGARPADATTPTAVHAVRVVETLSRAPL